MNDLLVKIKRIQKALENAEREITEVLSEQPEQSSEIQDILEYLDTVLHPIISPDHWNVYSELHDMISMLPSVQPEQLTDAEQRIFLKAIEREEKVCKKVDEEWGSGDEECEINLVHACHEIIRKVKGALWI